MATRDPKARLRVGLFLDGWEVERWIHQIVEQVQRSDLARVELVVMNTPPVEPRRTLGQKILRHRGQLLYQSYRKLDERLFRQSNEIFDLTDLRGLLREVPVVTVNPRRTKFCDYFPDDAVTEIRRYDLDVALRFGFRILKGDSLKVARHGVWSFHHADNHVNRGGPAGFWEVMLGEPVTGSVLQVLSEDLDNGKVIYRSFSPTDRRSVFRNRRNYYVKTAEFMMRKLRDLHADGEAGIAPLPEDINFRPYSHRLFRTPGNGEMLGALARMAGRFVADRIKLKLVHAQWILAYRKESGPPSPHRFRYIVPPADRFWADPFPVRVDDGWLIFIEEFEYARGKGHISVLRVDEKGDWHPPEKVLEENHHLSYPCVFSWRNEWYMMPESNDRRTLDVYRAVEFPRRWEHHATLMEGVKIADATVVEIDGRWWLFACMAQELSALTDELFLFYSDSPLGPWKPHRRNPVVSDARRARPAGRPFEWKGQWYRPGQDCGARYGGAVVIHRIDRLDLDRYEETEVSRLVPDWDPRLEATHSLNHADGLTVIDAVRRRARLPLM